MPGGMSGHTVHTTRNTCVNRVEWACPPIFNAIFMNSRPDTAQGSCSGRRIRHQIQGHTKKLTLLTTQTCLDMSAYARKARIIHQASCMPLSGEILYLAQSRNAEVTTPRY